MSAQKQQLARHLRFIFGLPKGYIFTTREVLPFASRDTIDTTLSRMVRSGMLERLARGVFRFNDPQNKPVTVNQVAAIKRRAFGRKIATVANHIRRECLPRLDDRGRELLRPSRETLASDGRTSSFLMHTNWARINLKSVSPRLLKLGESSAGKAMRDLWLVGELDLSKEDVNDVWQDLSRREKDKVPAMKRLMPQWLTEMLPDTPEDVLEKLMIKAIRRPVMLKPRKQTNKGTDKETDKQTDKQTDNQCDDQELKDGDLDPD